MVRPAGSERVVAPGDVLEGKYRVDRVIGKGGMGYVAAAWHLRLDERVALKFLRPSVIDLPGVAARFEREAQAAAKIKGEHVCRVLDVGLSKQHGPFMVMEFLEGEDLGSRLARLGPLSVSETIVYVLQACEALAEAHERGIVHRDLKPANLFLTRRPNGQPLVKLLDFGISKIAQEQKAEARLTVANMVMGSFAYMSPEHVRSVRDVDHRTDVWALGVILFELLTGALPFPAQLQSELIAQISADEPIPLRALRPTAPVELETAILRCLSKDREARYSGVDEFAVAIGGLVPDAAPSVESIQRIVGVTKPFKVEPAALQAAARAAAAAIAQGRPHLPAGMPLAAAAAPAGAPPGTEPPVSIDEPTVVAEQGPPVPGQQAEPGVVSDSPDATPGQPLHVDAATAQAGRATAKASSAAGAGSATAASPVVFVPPPGAEDGRPSPALAAFDRSTVAPWTPGKLASLAGGDRRRLFGVVGVGAAVAILGIVLIIVMQPPSSVSTDPANGLRAQPTAADAAGVTSNSEAQELSGPDAGPDGGEARPGARASSDPSAASTGRRPAGYRPVTKTKKDDPYSRR